MTTTPVSNMNRHRTEVAASAIPGVDDSHGPEPEPVPVEYRHENKHATIFGIRDFVTLPQKRDEWITTTTTIEVDGNPFKLKIYPRGNNKSNTHAEYVSILLLYVGDNPETNPVNVSYQIGTKTKKYSPFESKFDLTSQPSSGHHNFQTRQDTIQDDLDTNGTFRIEVSIMIGTPLRQLNETNGELAPILIDSGAFYSIVPLNFNLHDERSTIFGVSARSVSSHVMEAQATGELPLNLPKAALKAHKMKADLPLLAVREAVKHGCVVVFGYGENKDAIICDENDIEITLKKPPLVTGKAKHGMWYVSDYTNTASSSSSMLSFENEVTIFSVVFVIVFVVRTGVIASVASAVVSTAVAVAAVVPFTAHRFGSSTVVTVLTYIVAACAVGSFVMFEATTIANVFVARTGVAARAVGAIMSTVVALTAIVRPPYVHIFGDRLITATLLVKSLRFFEAIVARTVTVASAAGAVNACPNSGMIF